MKFKKINTNSCNLEAQWFTCKLPCFTEFIICNLYRPPQGNKTQFINYWLELVNPLKNINKKEVYVLGNTNICLKSNDNYSKMLIDTMKLCKLTQQIKDSTRLCKTKPTLIDHIYANSTKILSSSTAPINLLDHMLVYITRKRVKEIREKRICVRGRSIDPEFFPGYREDILNLDWSNVIKAESLNEMWSETEKNNVEKTMSLTMISCLIM